MGEEGRDHPPGKVLRHVLAGFRHVRFEHDEDDALRKFLLIDEEVAKAGHGTRPQHHADHRSHDAGLAREQQHGCEPEGAHHERLAETGKTGGAGQLNQQLGDAGKIPEEHKQPEETRPIETVRRLFAAFKPRHSPLHPQFTSTAEPLQSRRRTGAARIASGHNERKYHQGDVKTL
ncbi:hypothetical protein D3C86_1556330 [compost metagenome]